MTPGNYLEHCVTDWSRYVKEFVVPVQREKIFDALFFAALKAPRFLLPRYGIAAPVNSLALEPPIRLPYPITVLEFEDQIPVSHAPSGGIMQRCLVLQEVRTDCLYIQVCPFYRDTPVLNNLFDGWISEKYWFFIPVETSEGKCLALDTAGHVRCGLINARTQTSVDDPVEAASASGYLSLHVLAFVAALSCANVTTEVIPVSSALNKKRLAKGRLPFVEYKILQLGQDRFNRKASLGTHASPRQHFRRGHVRRLLDRRIWVSQCLVGSPHQGFIVKDYKVQA